MPSLAQTINASTINGTSGHTVILESDHSSITNFKMQDKNNVLYGALYGSHVGDRFGLLDGDHHWSYLAVKDQFTEFRVNNSIKMRIMADGKVGIGHTNPSARLHVNGDIKTGSSNGIQISQSGSTGIINKYGNGPLDFRQNNSTKASLLTNGTFRIKSIETYVGNMFISARDWGMRFDINTDNVGSDFYAWRSNNSEKMRLTNDGNLGLGITNPSEKLEVNGTIRAKEIIVETANWPDYVFGEEYESMSLIEKGQFFKNKHHLPALNNAKTYQDGGLPITEVVTGLTQEVEEAYLHLLDQQGQIDNLRKEMEELKKLVLAKK